MLVHFLLNGVADVRRTRCFRENLLRVYKPDLRPGRLSIRGAGRDGQACERHQKHLTHCLESLSKLEVELPAGSILVEPVCPVQSQRTKRGYQHRANACATEQSRWVYLCRLTPNAARIVERTHGQVVVEPDGVFRAHAQV